MTDSTEFSQDPYEDGTVPADADLQASDDETGAGGTGTGTINTDVINADETSTTETGSAESDSYNPQPGTDPLTEDEKDRAERHY